MKTKLYFLLGLLTFGFLITSCNRDQANAEHQLELAKYEYQHGNFNEAKMLIDSIKILFPKAYEARRNGIELMQEVELTEQEQTLSFLDSLMTVKQEELAAIVGNFKLE